MAAPTRRPWRRTPNPEPGRTWIEGPEGSGDTGLAAKDRRIVLDAELFGDPEFDAETMANIDFVVELANADAGVSEES